MHENPELADSPELVHALSVLAASHNQVHEGPMALKKEGAILGHTFSPEIFQDDGLVPARQVGKGAGGLCAPEKCWIGLG